MTAISNVGFRTGTIRTVPYHGRQKPKGAKVPLHQRVPVNPGRQDVSFTGRGFVPDYMTDHALTMMPEASTGTLEGGNVPGSEGMMPPPGFTGLANAGQKQDSVGGGAGSFATSFAARTKISARG
jgi:hypothetical protein